MNTHKRTLCIVALFFAFSICAPAAVPEGRWLTSGTVTINVGKLSTKAFGPAFSFIPDSLSIMLASSDETTTGYVVTVIYRNPEGKLLKLVDRTGVQPKSTFGMVLIPVDLATVSEIESIEVVEVPPGKALTFN